MEWLKTYVVQTVLGGILAELLIQFVVVPLVRRLLTSVSRRFKDRQHRQERERLAVIKLLSSDKLERLHYRVRSLEDYVAFSALMLLSFVSNSTGIIFVALGRFDLMTWGLLAVGLVLVPFAAQSMMEAGRKKSIIAIATKLQQNRRRQ